MRDAIHIEVAYALPDLQHVVPLVVAAGTTLQQAVAASGLCARYAEIDQVNGKFGIYGKLARPDTPLREHDRVEIYRPLIADPQEMRRRRAAAGKAMKKGT